MDTVLEDIRNSLHPDRLEVERGVVLVAMVGEGMARTVGISAEVLTALKGAQVNVRLINQGASELNVMIGVVEKDFETSLHALYTAFVEL